MFDETMNRYIDICNTLDEPISYKDWLIYPVEMRRYNDFMVASEILDIDKSKLGNIDIIQMSYLKFLIEIVWASDKSVSDRISVLFKLCFHNDDEIKIERDLKDKYSLNINGKIITAREFDDIRHIILMQNLVAYKDMSRIDATLRDNIEEYYRIKSQGIEELTLERKFAIIQSQTGMLKKDLLDMTIRSFDILFNEVVDSVDYKLQKAAEMAGAKFDPPIEHWVWKKHKGEFSDAFASYGKLESEINSVNK